MHKPLTKIKCCAFEKKLYDREKNFQIEYYIDLEGKSISDIIKVKGNLKHINSITEKDYFKWKTSNDIDNYFKQKEYEIISRSLIKLGQELKYISDFINKEFYAVNCDSYQKRVGGRKLKSFEEEILLYTLKNKSTIYTPPNISYK